MLPGLTAGKQQVQNEQQLPSRVPSDLSDPGVALRSQDTALTEPVEGAHAAQVCEGSIGTGMLSGIPRLGASSLRLPGSWALTALLVPHSLPRVCCLLSFSSPSPCHNTPPPFTSPDPLNPLFPRETFAHHSTKKLFVTPVYFIIIYSQQVSRIFKDTSL